MSVDARSAARTTAPRTSLIIGVLVVGSFVALLNETMLTVTLPTLARDFAIDLATAQWATSGFFLTVAVVVPTTGFLLARYTARRVFLVALGLFTAGTTIAATAPVFGLLLVGRVLQAAGTALLAPLLITTILRLVPLERRGAAMGTVSLVIATGPALGPTLGGLLLDRWGWRGLFASVLPLALAVLVAGAILLRVPTATRAQAIDVASVGLAALGFGGLVHGFATVGRDTSIAGVTIPLWVQVLVGAAVLAVFVARQLRLQREDRALLDLRPFARPQFRATIAVALLTNMALLGVSAVLLPLYLQLGVGVTPALAGLAVLPGGLLLALLGRPVGRFHDRRGPRLLLPVGAGLLAAAAAAFALLPAPTLALAITLHLVLALGAGLTLTPLLTTALSVLPADLHTHGSAITTTLQQLAGAIATAGVVTVAGALSDDATAAAAPIGIDAAGLQGAFLAVGGLALIAFALSFRITGVTGPTPESATDR